MILLLLDGRYMDSLSNTFNMIRQERYKNFTAPEIIIIYYVNYSYFINPVDIRQTLIAYLKRYQ